MRKLILSNEGKKQVVFFTALDEKGNKLYDFWFNSRIGLYAIKVDMDRKEFIGKYDEGYDDCALPGLNTLMASGRVKGEFTPYRQYPVYPEAFSECTDDIAWGDFDELVKKLDVPAIVKEFADHGFVVSKKAIIHNFGAWLGDLKSGYRDRTCHLFTPCGCNPLSFRATELYPACSDWQTTYEC